MGFYWGECNPSFKYHSARADGAPGSGGAAMEGERRGGVTGARSGRALMLPTERLPLSRRPEDHLADPGSGAGGDGAAACLGEEKRDAGSRFPSGAHRSGGPASSSSGAERAALRRRWRGGRDGRGDTPGAGDGRDPPGGPAQHASIPSRPAGDARCPGKAKGRGGLGGGRSCKHGWAAGRPRLQGPGIPRRRGRSPAPLGRCPPGRRAGSERSSAPPPAPPGRAPQPARLV